MPIFATRKKQSLTGSAFCLPWRSETKHRRRQGFSAFIRDIDRMKRPEHIIEDLITRQLDGTPLTDTERRELQEWLVASEANRDAFLRAYKARGNARLAETRFNTGQALENVMARIAEASRPRSFLRPQLRRLGIGIAAAACVMLAVVGYYRLQPSTVPDIEMFTRQADTPVFTQ